MGKAAQRHSHGERDPETAAQMEPEMPHQCPQPGPGAAFQPVSLGRRTRFKWKLGLSGRFKSPNLKRRRPLVVWEAHVGSIAPGLSGAPNPEGGRTHEKCSLNFDADGGQIPGSENY